MMFRRNISPQSEHPIFDEKRFWIGISVGVSWSIVMYLFLQVFRSAVFFFFGYNGTVVTVIDFPEYRFYSFIIAFFSIMFGAYQFLEFTCFKNRTFFQSGLQKKIVLFNQRNIIWNVLFFSFKFLITGFLTLLIGTVSVWKIYSSGWWISVLLSLFLYFYFWNNLKRIYPNALKLSLIFFPITLGLAFGLSQIKPVDMEYYQEHGLKRTLHYTKQIDVPVSNDLEKSYHRGRVINFYIAQDPIQKNQVQYYFGHSEIQLEDISLIVENFKRSKPQHIHHRIIGNVIIDKDVSMKTVYPLLDKLRSSRIYTMGLVGIQENYGTRKNYYISFPHHLKVRLSHWDEAIASLTNQLKQNPNTPKTSWEKHLDKSIYPWGTPDDIALYYSSNYVIEILPDEVYHFNGKKIDSSNLVTSITKEMQTKSNQLVSFYLKVHPDASYESFFFVQQEFKKAKQEIRTKIAKEKFGKEFEYLSSTEQKEIRVITTSYIQEACNTNEEFLFDFFKKKKTNAISN